jgi:hypothetical protein
VAAVSAVRAPAVTLTLENWEIVPMNCDVCDTAIRLGESHVMILRNIEVVDRTSLIERLFRRQRRLVTAITVKDSEVLASYHRGCEPSSETVVFAKAGQVLDTIRSVAEVIEERGWIRCRYTECPDLTDYDAGYDPDDSTTWPVSIRGAINVVCRGTAEIAYECGVDEADADERVPVLVALLESLGLYDPADKFVRECPDEVLAMWEKAPGRTTEQVVAALADAWRGR